MTKLGTVAFKPAAFAGAAAFALLFSPVSFTHSISTSHSVSMSSFVGTAFAEDDGGQKGGMQHRGGGAGKGKGGSQGAGSKGGSDMGQGGQGTHVPGGIDKGEDSDDRKGPQYGGSGAGSTGAEGGKPVWAQEGIPEVELGRMNVARAPEQVLRRQLDEALASFTPEMATYYNMTLSDYINALKTEYDSVLRLNSPLANLALYKDLILNSGTSLPGVTDDVAKLSAIFIGTASDKELPITADSIKAINAILDLPTISDEAAAALAANADDVREAISVGHGS